jgi:hypothetical protein
VSIPLAASAYPVEWRSMWTWSGNGGLAGPFDHASNSHPAEWLAALIDEDVGAFRSSSLLLPLQELETVHLVAFQVVDAISAALEPMMVRFGRSMSSQRRSIPLIRADHAGRSLARSANPDGCAGCT